jgi:glycosyltransferase involved in cell wall biosynthesis
VVFVDDGSADGTYEALAAAFADDGAVRIVRHARNRGITAAILTGAAAARGDIIATLDADCSYDPMIVADLVAPIAAGRADLVTASPYHPRGAVADVPRWRLLLSRTASRLYRRVLPVRLHTYTSCCRAWRAAVAPALVARHPGFLGVTELLVSVIAAGWRVSEVPARLEPRRHGVSKMRTLRVLRGHLGLLLRLAVARRRPLAAPRPA